MSITCRTTIVVALAGLTGASCFHQNANYCEGAPHSNCLDVDAGPPRCTSDPECSPPLVCDALGTMTCVPCTPAEHQACVGMTPVCGGDDTCHGCTAHEQCASSVCLPDGSCGDDAKVAYVAPGGSGNECTKATPCGTLDDGIKTNRPVVKIAAGTIADGKTTTIDGQTVTILADRGAKLDRTGDGVILEIKNSGADVQIFDLEITGGTGVTDAALSIPNGGAPKLTLTRVKIDVNQGIGILAAAGTLTVSQSTMSGNTGGGISATGGMLTVSQSTVSGNTGGGISISGAEFDITNSVIVKNGGPTSGVGGLEISQILIAGTHRLEFSTITANVGNMTVNAGVNCSTVVVPVTFDSDIIFGNTVTGGGQQIGGSATCTATYSDVGPDTVSGTGNINLDPMFVSAAQDDFHLMPGSPAKDAADPTAALKVDLDGDSRPQGPYSDMGADEVTP